MFGFYRFSCAICLTPKLRMVYGICQHKLCEDCLYGNTGLRSHFLEKCPTCGLLEAYPRLRSVHCMHFFGVVMISDQIIADKHVDGISGYLVWHYQQIILTKNPSIDCNVRRTTHSQEWKVYCEILYSIFQKAWVHWKNNSFLFSMFTSVKIEAQPI